MTTKLRHHSGFAGRTKPIMVNAPYRSDLTLLAVSDLHCHDIAILMSAVRHFEPDVVVFAGDGLHECAKRGGDGWLRQLANLTPIGVFAIAGNADGPDALRKYGGDKVYDLAKRAVDVGSIRFVGLAGAPIIDGLSQAGLGSPLYRERDARRHLERFTHGHTGPVVLVTHAPPRGLLDHSMRFAGDVGSIAVRELIHSTKADLRLVLCGHVHYQGGQHILSGGCAIHNVASYQGEGSEITICHLALKESATHSTFATPANAFGTTLPWTRYGEIGFLAGMPWPVAERLVAGGISRLSELAVATGKQLSRCIGWKPEKAAVWASRAQAFLESRPVRVGPLGIPDLPRWYIDIETDAWGGRECVWAVALASHETGKITQWYLKRLSGHRKMLAAVATALAEIPAGKLLAYSGSRFDERILADQMRRSNVPVPLSLETAIDLHPAILRSVALPETGQLKAVLRAFSIVHRDGDLDGFEVASRAMRALRNRRPIPGRLLRYNREDVRTLRALAIAVTEMAGTTAPLRRRAHLSGGAARKAADEKRVAELLSARGLTIAELAKKNLMVRARMERGLRVTSLIVERALGEIDKGV
jgi:Icc-related predicted phosphoesterase